MQFGFLLLIATMHYAHQELRETGLIGEWRIKQLTLMAIDEPLDKSDWRLIFLDDGTMLARSDATKKASKDCTFTINRKTSPYEINFIYNQGRPDQYVLKGIFKIEKGTLSLCRASSSKTSRPTEFLSSPDSLNLLIICVRVSK